MLRNAMSNIETVQRKIFDLEDEADELLQLGIEILKESGITTGFLAGRYLYIFTYEHPYIETQRKAIRRYEDWYSASLYLIKEYAPDRASKFKKYYYHTKDGRPYGVSTYFRLTTTIFTKSINDVINSFCNEFNEQIAILTSLASTLGVKEMMLIKLISANFVRTELEEAEELLAAKHYRAAGAVAGVALELILKTLCDVHSVAYPATPNIQTLLQALHKSRVIDTARLKYLEYLANIRNKCSHAENITAKEVESFILEVRKQAKLADSEFAIK